jgi:hypothetical protein
LGDLSQILDQRSCEQAVSLLSAIGDDLKKFVFTDAYEKSANALDERGFVLLPEVARRLGDRRFTGKLRLELEHILKFVEEPKEILLDTIRGLDVAARTALGVIFMSGGRVEYPLDRVSDPLNDAIRTLGSNVPEVEIALGNVRGSFTIFETEGSRHF